MRPCVFLERDGILNQTAVIANRLVTPLTLNDFNINLTAVEQLKQLKEAGYLLIVTTNQPGVSSGQQSRRELDLMHSLLMRRFPLDDILVCPHDEAERCPCRKPKPGLLSEAAFKWHIDLDRSFVVSEKWQDAAAAHAVGCTSLLIASRWNGTGHHDSILPDLNAVVKKIITFRFANPFVATQVTETRLELNAD